MAPFLMHAHRRLNFRLERIRISLQNALNRLIALAILFSIATATAIALWPANPTLRKAVAIQFKALALLAIAPQTRFFLRIFVVWLWVVFWSLGELELLFEGLLDGSGERDVEGDFGAFGVEDHLGV